MIPQESGIDDNVVGVEIFCGFDRPLLLWSVLCHSPELAMPPPAKIDWDDLRKRLPTGRSEEEKKLRMQYYKAFDPNGNGYLSLAEVDKGCRDVLGLYDVFKAKKVIMRAFQAAKSANNEASTTKKDKYGPDYVEKCEFRLLLVYIRQYFELWQMFIAIDESGDQRISLEEFKKAVPQIEKWGVKITDPEATFKKVDSDNGGMLLFDEFAHWALQEGLDLEDDDDFDDEALQKARAK